MDPSTTNSFSAEYYRAAPYISQEALTADNSLVVPQNSYATLPTRDRGTPSNSSEATSNMLEDGKRSGSFKNFQKLPLEIRQYIFSLVMDHAAKTTAYLFEDEEGKNDPFDYCDIKNPAVPTLSMVDRQSFVDMSYLRKRWSPFTSHELLTGVGQSRIRKYMKVINTAYAQHIGDWGHLDRDSKRMIPKEIQNERKRKRLFDSNGDMITWKKARTDKLKKCARYLNIKPITRSGKEDN